MSATLINLLALSVFGISLYFWKYIFPKRKLSLFLVLILFSCIPLISIWRTGSYQSGDFKDHIYFFMSFYKSLQNGILFPRWSGAFCGGYGYPHIQYFYHLPYYVASFFHFIGFTFLDSMKLLLCVTFVGAAASMYLWLKSEWGEVPAFVGSLLYILAPYNLAGVHFRVTIGEGLGLVIFPLILWCVKKVFDKSTSYAGWYWWGIGIGYIGLILAHHVVPILCLPFLITYFFFKMWQEKDFKLKKMLLFMAVLALSFLVTSYHWTTILLEAQFIGQDHLRQIVFTPVERYFFSPWRFGLLNQGHSGELSLTIGYVQWLMILLAIGALFIRKISLKDKQWLAFLLFWFLALFVMLLPFTEPLWLALPIINNFQFSFRMEFLITLVVSVVGAIVIKNLSILFKETNLPRKFYDKCSSHLIILLVIVMSLTTILNWAQRTMIPDLDDEKLMLLIPAWCDRVAIPSWLDEKEFKNLPKRTADLETISGTAFIKEEKFDMELHEYKVSATTAAKLRENTTYFPGWKIYIDGSSTAVTYDDPAYKGIMEFYVPAGEHEVKVAYEYTDTQALFNRISRFALFIWCFLTVVCVYYSNHD